jgi:hypothetical protein
MYRMAPIAKPQLRMVLDHLETIGREPAKGFTARDLVLMRRVKGRMLVRILPGLGAPSRWLERKTDDDVDYID